MSDTHDPQNTTEAPAPGSQGVTCKVCGGRLVVEPSAFRRGFVTCAHCRAVTRVHAAGAIVPASTGMAVREHAGAWTVTARCVRGTSVIDRREVVGGLASGAIATVAITATTPLRPGILGLLVSSVVATFVLGALRRWLPPLRIEGGTLHPSSRFVGPVPASAVRQVYVTAPRLHTAGEDAKTFYNVYALLGDGRRVHLLGPVDREETAFAVEDALETRLELFDLPVAGQAQPVLAPVAAPAVTESERQCVRCGAPYRLRETDVRRGYSTCGSCRTLLLVYGTDGALPVLGTERPWRCIVDVAGGAVRVRHAGGAVVAADPGGLWFEASAGAMPWDRVACVDARRQQPASVGDVVALLYRQGAHSGDVDFSKPEWMENDPDPRYEVVVRGTDGVEHRVLRDLENPAEALAVARALAERITARAG